MIRIKELGPVSDRIGNKAMSLKRHFREFLRQNGVNFEGTWRAGAVFPELDHANAEHQALAAAVATRFFALHHGYSGRWKAQIGKTLFKRRQARGSPKHYAIKLTLRYD